MALAVTTVMRTAAFLVAATSSFFIAAQARAQVDMVDPGLSLSELPMDLAELPREAPASRLGFALQLGGGLTGFARRDVREDFSSGGYWELRAVLGTRRILSGELAYVGSHRRADAGATTASWARSTRARPSPARRARSTCPWEAGW
jgi:hypothetical protein